MATNVENITNPVRGLVQLPLAIQLVTLSTAALDILTTWVPGFAFRFVKMELITTTVGTGTSASQEFDAYIDGVAVTGGTLNFLLADTTPTGKIIQGATPTALNIGSATSTLTISLKTGGTAFTAGAALVMVTLQNLSESAS
jgi:hypothetical protein